MMERYLKITIRLILTIVFLPVYLILVGVFLLLAIPTMMFGKLEVEPDGTQSIVWKWEKN